MTVTRPYQETELRTQDIKFKGRRFFVGAVARGGEGRQEHQGPMVPGPWAYAGATGIVLAAHPLPEKPYVEVAEGDLLEIDGDLYLVSDARNRSRYVNDDWVDLHLVTGVTIQ
jgi:hypothetical protein